jgi:hypothetical protein
MEFEASEMAAAPLMLRDLVLAGLAVAAGWYVGMAWGDELTRLAVQAWGQVLVAFRGAGL